MAEHYDVIVIGAGVVGAMVARTLSQYKLDILLIDKEADVCVATSAANSAIIHAGYDAVAGTLKAEMSVEGNRLWSTVCQELNVSLERCGTYVVAVGPDELEKLDPLLENGQRNGVPALDIISGEEMRLREPALNEAVSGALWAPTGGVVNVFAATVAAAENAVMNGVTLKLNTAFEDFIIEDSRIVGIKTNQGEFGCRWVVNSAGLYADEVMHKAGTRPEFEITPRRGEYFVFDPNMVQVGEVLFPVPGQISKGVVVTTTTHGNTMIGPNAENIDDKEDTAVTQEGLNEIATGALKLIPSLDLRHVIASFAGLRAGGNAPCKNPEVRYGRDFVIEIAEEVDGLVNLGGIESPGLTSSPAIAERVVALLEDAGEELEKKPNWNRIRPARPKFHDMTHEERTLLVQKDPRYGRIVCRCESVTEGEIVAEINAPIPARTYDAIKRRTWCGAGRCQGGFDMPRVVEILSHELGIPPDQVTKKGAGSEFLMRPTKEVEA
ncbi:MAG: NAD(P)/FAD-dependent oxidoreductase [Chloroflexota bacterium]